jgi:alpha-ketoglutarate-dependent taurine dioxygenase
MNVEPIQPHIGARIHVARDRLCDPEVVEGCLQALERHGVLVFPQIGLTDAEQAAFTHALGAGGQATRHFPGGAAVEGEVFEISLNTDLEARAAYVKVSFFWHMDGLLLDAPLPKAALLSARRVAPSGGQTEFASTFAAYEQLPEAEKAQVADLRAVHTPVAGLRQVLAEPPSEADLAPLGPGYGDREHPLVWTQASGRKSLIVSSTADRVLGLPIADGRALLARLLEWTAQPAFKYRHEWQEGDLLIWNNHGVVHRVLPYDAASGRTMRRTSIERIREGAPA